MKRVLLVSILCILSLPTMTFGQTVNKGSIYIGALGGYNKHEYGGSFGFLMPRFEYLIGNKFSIGTDLGFFYNSIKWTVSSTYVNLAVSPFTRYYFLNRKITPIVELNFFHGFHFDNQDYVQYDTNVLYINAGISTPRLIFNRVGFDLTTGFAWRIYPEGSQFNYSILTSFRITYCIRKQ